MPAPLLSYLLEHASSQLARVGLCYSKPPQSGQRAAKRAAPARASRPAARRGGKRDDDQPEEPKTSLKGVFAKDLGDIMYGFGDSTDHPVPETLDAVEAVAVEFVKDLITKCLHNVRLRHLHSR